MKVKTLILVSLLACLTGCHGPKVATPLTAELGKDDPDTQMEFWHRLGERPMTSNDDAFHGLLLYLDGKDPSPDYAARVKTLKDRNILPEYFNRPADEAITRGNLAMALMKVARIRGGVMANLLGPTPRYATRELVYNGLYPPSSPNQTFTGSEYVGIIGRLEDYQRGDPAEKSADYLPGETPK